MHAVAEVLCSLHKALYPRQGHQTYYVLHKTGSYRRRYHGEVDLVMAVARDYLMHETFTLTVCNVL